MTAVRSACTFLLVTTTRTTMCDELVERYAADAIDLAGEYADHGLHPVHLARLRRLARLLDVTVDDLIEAATQ